MENKNYDEILKEMGTMKNRINGIAQRIRNKNKDYWGTETTLKSTMTKSQAVKKEFMITTFGEDITTVEGNLIETTIIEKFGKYGELKSIVRDFGGFKGINKYFFKIK